MEDVPISKSEIVAIEERDREFLKQMQILRKEIKGNLNVGFWGMCSGGVVRMFPTEYRARKAGEKSGSICLVLIEKGRPFAIAQVGYEKMEEFIGIDI